MILLAATTWPDVALMAVAGAFAIGVLWALNR